MQIFHPISSTESLQAQSQLDKMSKRSAGRDRTIQKIDFKGPSLFMTIDFHCPECQRSYRVKDEFAGRKLRCKQCQSAIEVPDIDPWEIDDDFEEYDDPVPKKRKKRRKRKRSGNSIPVAIWIPLVLLGLLLLLIPFELFATLTQGRHLRAIGIVIRAGILARLIMGLVQKGSIARVSGIILMCLFLLFAVFGFTVLEERHPNFEALRGAYMLSIGICVTISACLCLPSAREYCSE